MPEMPEMSEIPIVNLEGQMMSEDHMAAIVCNDWIQNKLKNGKAAELDAVLGADSVIGAARDLRPQYIVKPGDIPWMIFPSKEKTRADKEADIRTTHKELVEQGAVGENLYINKITYWVLKPEGSMCI